MVTGTVFAPFAVASSPSGQKLCGRDQGGWESIDVPFTEGTQVIRSWSISSTTSLIFATNGTVVMRSTNRGCSWQEVWSLGAIPESGNTVTSTESVIEQVHVSESPLAPSTVFVTVDQLRPVSRPRGFGPSERGLEAAAGRPEMLATAKSNPGKVYLLTDTSGITKPLLPDQNIGVAQSLFESVDGGRTWQVPRVYTGDPYDGIEVDPVDADEVWLYGSSGAVRSVSPTGQQQTPVPGPIGYVDVWHNPGSPARVLAAAADAPQVWRSDAGARSFNTSGLPGVAQSIVSLSPIQEIYATSAGVFFMQVGGGITNLSPSDGRTIVDLHLTTGAGTELWGRTDATIERKTFSLPRRVEIDYCKEAQRLGFAFPGCGPDLDIDVPCVHVPDPGEPALKPASLDVTLKPGQTKTVHYDFDLPTKGRPLDVFFLIDVSGSMQDAIDGTGRAMTEIVTQLTSEGIDVNFGVGEYRSYTQAPAYRRVLDISNDCGAVEAALEGLIASGGGEETQLEALYQVARGEPRPGFQTLVPSGQDATFRESSTRVIIHTTDETISEGPPNPTYEEVAEALNSAGDIKQIGVAIEDSFGGGGGIGGDPPSEGLTRVARDTNTVAPEEGVDCNGDGTTDIGAGEPLVCKISPLRAREASAMAPAIINTIRALRDPQTIEFGTLKGAPVIEQGPPEFLRTDLNDPRNLGFDVSYSCPRLHTGKKFPVEIAADMNDERVALARALVTCKVPPLVKKAPPPAILALPLIPFIPPPPVPPEIPPAPNPNPNPNPNPQSQAQAQAQGAMAHQEQQQPQLAYVYAQHEHAAALAQESAGGKETEFAMSSYSEDSDGVPPEAFFIIGAMTMTAAFGCLTLAREKVRVEHVRR